MLFEIILHFCIWFNVFQSFNCTDNIVDVKKTLIWGPGLNPKFSAPLRYFYIQPVNSKNEK